MLTYSREAENSQQKFKCVSKCSCIITAIAISTPTNSKRRAQVWWNLPAMQDTGFDPWVGKILWRREWLCTPVFLPGESHGLRSLARYSPWCHKKSDTTEPLTYTKWLVLDVRPPYTQKQSLSWQSLLPNYNCIGDKIWYWNNIYTHMHTHKIVWKHTKQKEIGKWQILKLNVFKNNLYIPRSPLSRQ